MGCRGIKLVFQLLTFLFFPCTKNVNAVTSSTNIKTLLDNILPTSGATPYYDSMRPITNQDNVVEVTADLYLIAINAFDDTEQKLTTTAYLEVTWADEVNLC